MNKQPLKLIVEAVLMATDQPLSINKILEIFPENERPDNKQVREAIQQLQQDYAGCAIKLAELASGFCFQVRATYGFWIAQLFQQKPPRYSRALLETLAIIAYRQPVTRAEIEEIRGVAVSTAMVKTLSDREWIRVVGHRDIPGKPVVYGTTKQFLDYFNLKSLKDLPELEQPDDVNKLAAQLDDAWQIQEKAMPNKTIAQVNDE